METTETQAGAPPPEDPEGPFEYPEPEGVASEEEEVIEGMTAEGAGEPEPGEPEGEPDPIQEGADLPDDELPPEEELGEDEDPSGGAVEGGETAKQSVADLAANGEPEGEPEDEGPPPVEGLSEDLDRNPGGKVPDVSTVKLSGVSREVTGQFERQQTATFVVIARCQGVNFVDTVDSAGQVTKAERRHTFKVESVRRV